MFKRTETDLSGLPTERQQSLTRDSNMPGCCYIKYFLNGEQFRNIISINNIVTLYRLLYLLKET